jgi:hypothetical protein
MQMARKQGYRSVWVPSTPIAAHDATRFVHFAANIILRFNPNLPLLERIYFPLPAMLCVRKIPSSAAI